MNGSRGKAWALSDPRAVCSPHAGWPLHRPRTGANGRWRRSSLRNRSQASQGPDCCSSHFQSRSPTPLLPPASAVISSVVASAYTGRPMECHQRRIERAAKVAVRGRCRRSPTLRRDRRGAGNPEVVHVQIGCFEKRLALLRFMNRCPLDGLGRVHVALLGCTDRYRADPILGDPDSFGRCSLARRFPQAYKVRSSILAGCGPWA